MRSALRFAIWAYLLSLALIAAWSVAAFVLESAPWPVVAAEIAVDMIAIVGVPLFLLDSRIPAWRWLVVLAVAGQTALFFVDPPETLSDAAFVLGFLAPALVLNVIVASGGTQALRSRAA